MSQHQDYIYSHRRKLMRRSSFEGSSSDFGSSDTSPRSQKEGSFNYFAPYEYQGSRKTKSFSASWSFLIPLCILIFAIFNPKYIAASSIVGLLILFYFLTKSLYD